MGMVADVMHTRRVCPCHIAEAPDALTSSRTECEKWRKMLLKTVKFSRRTNLRTLICLPELLELRHRCRSAGTSTTSRRFSALSVPSYQSMHLNGHVKNLVQKTAICGESMVFCTVCNPVLLELVAAVQRGVDDQELHCGMSSLLQNLHSAHLSLWHDWNIQHSVDELNLRNKPLSIGKDCWGLTCMSTGTPPTLSAICSWNWRGVQYLYTTLGWRWLPQEGPTVDPSWPPDLEPRVASGVPDHCQNLLLGLGPRKCALVKRKHWHFHQLFRHPA